MTRSLSRSGLVGREARFWDEPLPAELFDRGMSTLPRLLTKEGVLPVDVPDKSSEFRKSLSPAVSSKAYALSSGASPYSSEACAASLMFWV